MTITVVYALGVCLTDSGVWFQIGPASVCTWTGSPFSGIYKASLLLCVLFSSANFTVASAVLSVVSTQAPDTAVECTSMPNQLTGMHVKAPSVYLPLVNLLVPTTAVLVTNGPHTSVWARRLRHDEHAEAQLCRSGTFCPSRPVQAHDSEPQKSANRPVDL